jgi:hypothetical protein
MTDPRFDGSVERAIVVATEGAADFFFGRPLDENPHARDGTGWHLWREGWLQASWFNDHRGDKERRRWSAA